MRAIPALMAMILATTVSASEVYRWVDKDGRVHYGDKPKAQQAEQVQPKPGSVLGGAAPSSDEAAAQAAARAAECARKQQQLATYKKAPSIKETDSLGRTREFTREEHDRLIALTEEQVAAACNPAANPDQGSDQAAN